MSTSAFVIVEFERPTANGKSKMGFDLVFCGFTAGRLPLDLIDKYELPLITKEWDLPDWQREITEAEYLELIGPPNLESLMAKHRFLRAQFETRQQTGREHYYCQFEHVLKFLEEFKHGNRPVRYILTVSDMG